MSETAECAYHGCDLPATKRVVAELGMLESSAWVCEWHVPEAVPLLIVHVAHRRWAEPAGD